MMRVGSILLLSALLASVVGCHRASTTTSVAAAGSAIQANPVGPVPGAPRNIQFTTNPLANDPVALQDGRRLFDWYNCSGCHGGHAGGGMGPSLRDPVWLYGNRDDQIFDTIARGRSRGMPAWGTKIPQQQIWELVAYIQSLGTANEPDPPVEPTEEQVPNPQQNEHTDQGTVTRIAGEQ
jgi:cytochrome c oxidase cbb3-type subunit III